MPGLAFGGTVRDSLIVDVCEGWNGFHNLQTGNAQAQLGDSRMTYDPMAGGATNLLFENGATGSLLAFDAAVGRVGSPWTSAAGITNITGGTGAGRFGVPLGLRFGAASAIASGLWPRPFRRYRVDYLVRGTLGPGAADFAVGIVSSNGNAIVTGGLTNPMVAWVARNGLNGGRWTPRYRLAALGAIVDGADSGVSFIEAPARVRQLSIVYEEGLLPRLQWLLDGRLVFELAGDANMITADGPCFLARAMGATAGVTGSTCYETRLRVWEVSA